MRVIGVVDLAAGRAVHARAGARERYAPVREIAGAAIAAGDSAALARGYVERLGIAELYVADLDAIGGAAPQDARVAELASGRAALWLDAGIATVDRARRALALGAARVIVGLETLPSFQPLADICAALGGERVAFSLDLRGGTPIAAAALAAQIDGLPAEVVAARAAAAGAGAVIVLDLARVGMSAGVDLDLIARVRGAVGSATLVSGGGVRGRDDLERMAEAGCDGALVASALHDGRIGAADVDAARRYQPIGRR